MQGRVCVLDMGSPVRIVDLARQMIRLAGMRPDVDVKIRYTGLRPGEKLYEELFHEGEQTTATAIPRINVATSRTLNLSVFHEALPALEDACATASCETARQILRGLVPEYSQEEARREHAAVN
jgi:O-antigen biosynthesis protein WbqV